MIIGLGTDIVTISRIRAVYKRHGERFLERTYSPAERDYCLAARDPAERLAARWAAKEACMKAFGTGWAAGLRFTDICVVRDARGKPGLELSGRAQVLAEQQSVAHVHCSLSHCSDTALAVVILESAP